MPTPRSRRGTEPAVPAVGDSNVAAAPSPRQVFLLLSFQTGTEEVRVPGLSMPVHLPVTRVEGSYSTYDAAYAAASRLNRDAAPMGKVFVVNAVNVPQP